jgi:hypothetical protein
MGDYSILDGRWHDVIVVITTLPLAVSFLSVLQCFRHQQHRRCHQGLTMLVVGLCVRLVHSLFFEYWPMLTSCRSLIWILCCQRLEVMAPYHLLLLLLLLLLQLPQVLMVLHCCDILDMYMWDAYVTMHQHYQPTKGRQPYNIDRQHTLALKHVHYNNDLVFECEMKYQPAIV